MPRAKPATTSPLPCAPPLLGVLLMLLLLPYAFELQEASTAVPAKYARSGLAQPSYSVLSWRWPYSLLRLLHLLRDQRTERRFACNNSQRGTI